jgi:glucose-6-phosphate dehydrogenase assembly protein OpcA
MLTEQSISARQVELENIESTVSELWSRLAQDAPTAPMRASVFNLVVFAFDESDAELARGALSKVLARHPSRILLVRSEPNSGRDRIEAWVSLLTQASETNVTPVYGEHITLIGHGVTSEELHSTVLMHLTSEIPVVLWWRGIPNIESHLFGSLVQIADHVVVDSAPQPDSIAFWRMLRGQFANANFCDLNWARLVPWRQLVAQLFDHVQNQQLLQHIRYVNLAYSARGDQANPAQAFLLAAWLATRLGWQVSSVQSLGMGDFVLQFAQGETPIEVVIDAEERMDAHTGRMLECALTAEGKSGPVEFIITRNVREENVTARTRNSQGEIEYATTFEMRDESDILATQLDYLGRDRVLDAAWNLIVGLDL